MRELMIKYLIADLPSFYSKYDFSKDSDEQLLKDYTDAVSQNAIAEDRDEEYM